MTPGLGMDMSGAWYDDVLLVLGAGLIGDFNPHHINDEYAKGTRFGTDPARHDHRCPSGGRAGTETEGAASARAHSATRSGPR